MPSFEFSPVKLVYGGDALGFHAGHTVMAPGVLPGERAEVEEFRRQKGIIHARPLRILESSHERVEPPCSYFGRCGGCQYQHLGHTGQLAAKVEILRETLRRLGQIKWDGEITVHSGSAWNYRNQAQWKIGVSPSGAPALGFFQAESNRLVPIDACPILSPRVNSLLAAIGTEPWISALANFRELEILADDRDEKVMLTLRGAWNATTDALARKCLAELAGVATVAVAMPEGPRGGGNTQAGELDDPPHQSELPSKQLNLHVLGEPHFTYHVGGYAYRVGPTAFFQSSRFLISELVSTVVPGGAHEFSPPGITSGVAIDLYAGVGLFTLPLSTRFEQVIAVESHPQAAADLAANARAAGGNKIRIITETTFNFLRRCAQMEPDLVVMDPPRAGVGAETLKLLVRLRPQRLHYVSCSPPTLARDLGFLLKHGYQLDSLDLFDFFPQTYHIESLARLSPSR